MNDLLRLLTLQDANTRVVLLGTGLLGLACGLVGTFAVLSRRALVSDAVAHAALPGIAIAYLVVGERSFPILLAGAGATGLLAAVTISLVRAATRVRDDAVTAIVIAGFFAVGTVLLRVVQNRPSGDRAGLDAFIFGKPATMVRADLAAIALGAIIVVSLLAIFFKELRLLCFDRAFAAAQGWPVRALDLFLMTLLCLCTVVALPAVGIILAVALLVIPAAAARLWSDRLGLVTILAGLIGAASGVLGTAFSAVAPTPDSAQARGWPTGPVITLAATAFFALSFAFAPRRGLVPGLLRRRALARRARLENLLRSLYELAESHHARGLAFAELLAARSWSARTLERTIARARTLALVEASSLALTPAGHDRARDVVRRHRLWEAFLIRNAGLAPDHVDRDADDVEHLLPAQVVAALDAELADPRSAAPIPSPHPLA